MTGTLAPLESADVFAAGAAEAGALLSERMVGRVTGVQGLTVAVRGMPAPIGALCRIRSSRGGVVEAEVCGLADDRCLLSLYGEAGGVTPGDPVECVGLAARVPVGLDLLGRVVDARGRALDGRAEPVLNERLPLYADPPPQSQRKLIDTPLALGVRCIDALLTAGRGQRLGVFAGTGVGKSVLMGMMCRCTQADVTVVALVGERGREVHEFVERELGPEGMRRTVVVACTSDEAASLRVRAGFHATAIAEYFRDRGLHVLLMIDSLTRIAMAQRQIGLAAGEPPTTKGYTPSAFALLPRLLERAGNTHTGSITGIYTVLVEGDDLGEPFADAARGVLDGHIWLSRALANRGHYPAVDVLASVSRVSSAVTGAQHQADVRLVRRVLAVWADIEDLVSIGAYVPGANAEYDVAVQTREAALEFLRQERQPGASPGETAAALAALAAQIREAGAKAVKN